MTRPVGDDLQKLRDMLGRATALAWEHAVPCVLVGLAGSEGDVDFPEVVDFVESELRMEDAIFRLTRERIVLLVADVDRAGAEDVVRRILINYSERSTRIDDPHVDLHFFEVSPKTTTLTVKEVLTSLFAPQLAQA